jgi:hypothetical protein
MTLTLAMTFKNQKISPIFGLLFLLLILEPESSARKPQISNFGKIQRQILSLYDAESGDSAWDNPIQANFELILNHLAQLRHNPSGFMHG